MKRKIFISLMAIIASLSVGCNTVQQVTNETEADGTEITHEDKGDTYICESIPRTIKYDDFEIAFDSITFYEDKVNHGYNFYAIAAIDLKDMTEDDVYWMYKDDDLEFRINVDSEENEFDNEYLSSLAPFVSKENIYYIPFYLSKECRSSLKGEPYSISIYVTQGGKYETTVNREKTELDKRDTYYYFRQTIPETIDESESIDKDIYDHMVERMNKRLQNTLDLMQ